MMLVMVSRRSLPALGSRFQSISTKPISMLATIIAVATVCGAGQVKHGRIYRDNERGLLVAVGEIDLPSQMIWYVKPSAGLPKFREVYLKPPKHQLKRVQGDRAQKAQQLQAIERSRSKVMSVRWQVIEYAQKHDGKSPASIVDLGERHGSYSNDVFLLPDVDLGLDTNNLWRVANADALLAVELTPYVDDSKHWVLFADGRTERRDIDPALVAKYGLPIKPQHDTGIMKQAKEGETTAYKVSALIGSNADGEASFELFNDRLDETMMCSWDLSGSLQGSAQDLTEWAKHRATALLPYMFGTDAPVLNNWLSRFQDVYGQTDWPRYPREERRRRRRRRQNTTMFNMLGGRAAVRETLQLDAIQQTKQADATIPIESVKGVEVKSHPFEEMLAQVDGGRLPLAELVPEDRFFAYFAKPSALLPFINKGADFISQTGATFNSNRLNYGLKSRYLARLGISEAWIRFLLEKGLAREVAISMPDLFLIDGTDMTIIVRVSNVLLAKPALTMLGITKIGRDIAEHRSEAGDISFWSTRGDIIVFGTNREEVRNVVTLHDAKGTGSLGRSAEFRYMLNRLPINEDTRAYFYFSDSFIRRLVGPEVKIAQLRRLRARGEMERITAAVLHASLDGVKGVQTLDRLSELKYAPNSLAIGECEVHPDGHVSSPVFGSPGSMSTLLQHPVKFVSEPEQSTYKTYVDNYSRYWRQYFDPIAVRLDEPDESVLELTTYILPLIDNTAYNGLRSVINTHETGAGLKVPVLSPSPVLLLSLNVAEKHWIEIIRQMLGEQLLRYTGLDPRIFDSLGPGVHLAIEDADPIIALGSGDILGAFGGDMTGLGDEALWITILMTTFTRPTKIFVELQDPDAVLRALRKVSTWSIPSDNWDIGGSFYKIEGRDAWIYNFNFFSLLSLRLGVEVNKGFLVLSNIPWSQRAEIMSVENVPLNGARLAVTPGAGKKQLPGLFAAATEQQRGAVMNGIGYLYPMLLTGSASVKEAQQRHDDLFGFYPEHPDGGDWTWSDHTIRSTSYGTITHQVQPEHKPGDRDFGMLRDIDQLSVNMQFEDTGLRATCRWTLRQ